MTFHEDLEGAEKKFIVNDLKWLQGLKLKSSTLKSASVILGQEILSGQDLHDWLLTRVRRLTYSVSEFDYELKSINPDVKIKYPLADQGPQLETPWGSTFNLPTTGPDRIRRYANNISSSVYGEAKGYQEHLKIDDIPGLGVVQINSPRTGIININFALFDPNFYGHPVSNDSLAARIFRLSTLFHEARHSDGQGVSLSFPHSLCPKGHRFEGLASCDETKNGSYAVGRVVMQILLDSTELDANEKEFLKAHLLDWDNRLHPHPGEKDLRKLNPEPEILINNC